MTKDRMRVEVKVLLNSVPLSCPLPNMPLWDMHPKVYLVIDQHNEAICPYCSTHYIAIEE